MVLLAGAGQVKNVLLRTVFTHLSYRPRLIIPVHALIKPMFQVRAGSRCLYTLCPANDHIVLQSQALCQAHILGISLTSHPSTSLTALG